jgi:catechol 2,3-dioxygenase-like lactoylglutathione lyase family enzyme
VTAGTTACAIAGIQQVGIGVVDAGQAFDWYRRWLGADIQIFDEAAPAALMTRYTGGAVHHRRAILAINLRGGGGFELWQFTSREPRPPRFAVELGDLGLLAARVKTASVPDAHARLAGRADVWVGSPRRDPAATPYFWIRDPGGNLLQVVDSRDWFGPDWIRGAADWLARARRRAPRDTGGVVGCAIGVSDVERALTLYRDVLGFDRVLYDREGVFDDLGELPGGARRLRRVLLGHAAPRCGAFSKLLGAGQIELVCAVEGPRRKLFDDRFWGDLGFIHLCFDVWDMDAIRRRCEAAGFPFTIDSASSFDMGDAMGRFAYVEDPDGTLIEFVETHKIPVAKRLGLFVDLRRRDPTRPLPTVLLKALAVNRVR